ncbi:beta-ketoacyl-[acyl-carrier-protein] synthase family protein [Agreia sp. Leaf283]|uniref:beta-ketoacyl-[acyl-carrier-protein] synthase family protein n=1 Tax=Agreia sp. Leaf283 TaxID=1736321 RepID=UPI0006FBA10B|nr:beta-ketoacyl-[acyl-carrier-protein] synthase family protein [Agreia sp. Leaf283]KQP54126.1 3-oxoacyl-ACP synthase [Agreia sp. Leaf283]
MSRIVVTGIGLQAASGRNADESWVSIMSGTSGIAPTTVVPTDGLISSMGGQVWGLPASRSTYLDRCHGLAVDAAREALAGSGVPEGRGERIAISLGTSLGGARSGQQFHDQWIRRGLRSANTALLRHYPLHSVADHLASTFGLLGPRSVQSNACAAGAVAIAYAVELLESGTSDFVLAGGVDPLALLSFGGFSCLGALDPLPCAPYTRSSGLNLGEGAGFLVLETEQSALARGASIHAEIAGYGLSADAYHATAPDPNGRGALRAMESALEMAGLGAEDIDYVNGHGTGTPANDSVERKVITHLRAGSPPPISSTKSMIGHTLGAAGAVEAVVSVLALMNQQIPPTHVPEGTDTAEDVDIVAGVGRAAELSVVVSNSFAFGGNNASLVIRSRPSGPEADVPRHGVVVTGIGAIAGSAATTSDVRRHFLEATPVFGSETVQLEHFGAFVTAEIPSADLTAGINPQHLRRMDTLGRRAAIAAGQLLRERRLSREEATGTGLFSATGTGPVSTIEAFERELLETGTGNTRLFPNTVMNAAAGHVALLNRLQGPTATISAGGTSGISALHFASALIARGAADRIMVVGADESPAAMLAGYARIPGYLARTDSVPFGGSGRLLGGAGVAILLEREGLAPSESVLGRLSGFGLTGDASGAGRLSEGSEAWARSFRLALADAAVDASAVDAIVSAACGRDQVDGLERDALELAGIAGVPLTAPKSVFGDAGAASALLGVAQAIWMGKAGRIPASRAVPVGAPPALVSVDGLDAAVSRTLVSSYEVGGSYQSVVVERAGS